MSPDAGATTQVPDRIHKICSTIILVEFKHKWQDESAKLNIQLDPTDLNGYVNLFLSRTGICMPVRLGLDRHAYACATQVRQAYVCLCDSG